MKYSVVNVSDIFILFWHYYVAYLQWSYLRYVLNSLFVQASGLGGAFGLNFKGTVFAPTNSAFDILLKELDVSLDALVDSKSKDIVGSVRHRPGCKG